MKILKDVDMGKYTSFKTGGIAREMILVDTEEELLQATNEFGWESFLLLGNGSNTLFASHYYDGVVIKLGEGFDYIEILEDGTIRAGAATLLSRLSKAAGGKGLTGLEFAAGIPGSVGGAVFMNAGAYDEEIKNTLVGIKALTGKSKIEYIEAKELDLSYRHSKMMDTGDIILEAEFKLEPGDPSKIAATMKDLSERRTSKQPLEYPSAGSFFKRPPAVGDTPVYAGKLIEDSGLKGFSIGGAEISEKHAGFVINKGNATPDDIINLMKEVQRKVKEDSGITLEPEVRII